MSSFGNNCMYWWELRGPWPHCKPMRNFVNRDEAEAYFQPKPGEWVVCLGLESSQCEERICSRFKRFVAKFRL